jgi:subtilisin family serine protease
MHQLLVPPGELPLYHEGMLLVKLRPTAAIPLVSAATAVGASLGIESPIFELAPAMAMAVSGAAAATVRHREATAEVSDLSSFDIGALGTMARAGRIKRVVPLTSTGVPESVAFSTPSILMSMAVTAAGAKSSESADPLAGTAIVELQRESDAHEVQVALSSDQHVELVDRVPVRYLAFAASRKSGRGGRNRMTAAEHTSAEMAPAVEMVPAAVPPPVTQLWNLAKIGWPTLRASDTLPHAGSIRVAVLDTGLDTDHPDLPTAAFYRFDHPEFPNASGAKDYVGHGTHVAGTIAARFGNALGIDGICQCQLYAWKIFSDRTTFLPQQGYYTYLVDPVMYRRALLECAAQGVQVVNLSIGGGGKPDFVEAQLFQTLLSSGVTIVAAMGNAREAGSPTTYPAAIPGVIGVGATNIDDTVAKFSNRGSYITLSAPGVGIWSTLPQYEGQQGFYAVNGPGGIAQGKPIRRETMYDAWDGTSMASPHVAAAAALLLAKHGSMSPSDVRLALTRSAFKVPAMGKAAFDQDYGAGRLDLTALLK